MIRSRRISRREMLRGILPAVALLAISVCRPADATTLMRMSFAQMARASQLIVRARCMGETTNWDAGEIWTFTSFRVEETWHGAAPSQISVRLLGGRYGNVTSKVSGVPRFAAGEEVILFLERTRRGDFSVVSWEQGTFRIHRDASGGRELAVEDTAAFPVFDPATRQFAATGIRNVPVAELRSRVGAALQGDAGRLP